jgi:hypothetical protein
LVFLSESNTAPPAPTTIHRGWVITSCAAAHGPLAVHFEPAVITTTLGVVPDPSGTANTAPPAGGAGGVCARTQSTSARAAGAETAQATLPTTTASHRRRRIALLSRSDRSG